LEETVDHFELQPAESELEKLADEFWAKLGEKYQRLERDAFEAGALIRNGNLSRANLEILVRWKSERVAHYITDSSNSDEDIKKALTVAVSPDSSVYDAVTALTKLRGVGVPVASAILTWILPDRYTVLDFRALEALGYVQQNAGFYVEYLTFCKRLADSGIIKPQENLPAPTALRALDRALWQWSKNASQSPSE
jgi:hypothetical protein